MGNISYQKDQNLTSLQYPVNSLSVSGFGIKMTLRESMIRSLLHLNLLHL